MKIDNLIIGSGITGLSFACFSEDDYIILEKESIPGGYTDIENIVKYIKDVKKDNKIREDIYLNFNYTYDFSINRILEAFKLFL